MQQQVHVKLLEGVSYTVGGMKFEKRKLKTLPGNHPLVPFLKDHPKRFQVTSEVARGPARRVRGRGGRAVNPTPEVIVDPGTPFGSPLKKIQEFTRRELIERIAEYRLDIRVKKNMKVGEVAQAVFEAEQDALTEPDDTDTDTDDNSKE